MGQGDPPHDQHDADGDAALEQGARKFAPGAFRTACQRRSKRAQHEDDRDERQILEQQHGEGSAADRALRADHRQHHGGGRQGEREAQPDRAGGGLAQQVEPRRDQKTAADQFGRADPEHLRAHRPEPLEAEFKADREEQQDDAQFREGLDRLSVRYGDMIEPRVLIDQRAKARRPDRQPHQDETDDRTDPKSGEAGND